MSSEAEWQTRTQLLSWWRQWSRLAILFWVYPASFIFWYISLLLFDKIYILEHGFQSFQSGLSSSTFHLAFTSWSYLWLTLQIEKFCLLPTSPLPHDGCVLALSSVLLGPRSLLFHGSFSRVTCFSLLSWILTTCLLTCAGHLPLFFNQLYLQFSFHKNAMLWFICFMIFHRIIKCHGYKIWVDSIVLSMICLLLLLSVHVL